MGQTKQLALNTVPQNIIVQSVCSELWLKEDESIVAVGGGSPFIIKKPAVTGDANYIQAGKSYSFPAPSGMSWVPGMVLGQIYLPTGSTTGIQDEK
jgi:hypothetical protein